MDDLTGNIEITKREYSELLKKSIQFGEIKELLKNVVCLNHYENHTKDKFYNLIHVNEWNKIIKAQKQLYL